MNVIFVTSNKHKVREANKVAKKFGVRFVQKNLGYPESRDNSVSNVALDGVKHVYARVKKPVVVEDSGLFVKSLNGFPGSYSRYVFDRIGFAGLIELLRQKKDRSAFFASAVAFSDGKTARVFEGIVQGHISKSPRGSSGFGFDPVFIPKGFNETFAENPELKEFSHRSIAFESFCIWLKSNNKTKPAAR